MTVPKSTMSASACSSFRSSLRQWSAWLIKFALCLLCGRFLFLLSSQASLSPQTRGFGEGILPKDIANATVAKEETITADQHRLAYITYATDDTYACSALVLADSIRKTEMDPSIDIGVMYAENSVSQQFIDKFTHYNLTLIPVPLIRAQGDRTWVLSLTKLWVFNLTQYDRVVYIDGDSIALRNMDDLFDLPDHFLYAQRAYWLKQPFVSSNFLVIQPSTTEFNYLMEQQKVLGRQWGMFDMDLINKLYIDKLKYLPTEYDFLNGDFNNPSSFKDPTKWNGMSVADLANTARIAHFSESPRGGYGKPWHKTTVRKKPNAHPLYEEIFDRFWKGQAAFCG